MKQIFKKNDVKTKVDGIDLSKYIQKNKYDGEVGGLKLKIPDVNGLLQTSIFNSKITEIENKIPDIKNLVDKTELTAVENKISDVKKFASKSGLTAVENKIPADVSSLVKKKTKKTDYATDITYIKNNYSTKASWNAKNEDFIEKTKFDNEFKKVDDKVAKNS